MTQRLTPETERAIRDRARASLGDAGVDRLLLLDELDALRAELAGAEERWYRRGLSDALHDGYGAIEHLRTGTTPPDAGESDT